MFLIELDAELKNSAFVLSVWENADVTTKLLTDNFAGKEPYASSIWVDGAGFL